jgi:hypothetical protein
VVTLTATDSGGATATCNFTVTVWDVAIQDDQSGDILYINSFTGKYLFKRCRGNLALSGTGSLTRVGCKGKLKDDTRVEAEFDICSIFTPNLGSAIVQPSPLGTTFSLKDGNLLNQTNTCR